METVKEMPLRILAIDGGGVMGLFSAEVLASLEEEYGKPMSQYFDVICGTSAGGLIALALAAGMPASKMVQFYKESGPKIFPYSNKVSRFLSFGKMFLFRAKYSSKPLKKALEDAFGDKKMEDALSLVCIPSYNLTLGKPKVFKSPFFVNGKNLWTSDRHTSLVDVGLATTAAPTFFPVHKIDTDYFVDGGVWCNNPAICGITEAMRYFLNKEVATDEGLIKYTSVQLLSLSTINKPSGWTTRKWKNRSAFLWLKGNNLIQPFMEGQNFFTDFFLSTLKDTTSLSQLDVKYYRISHQSLSNDHLCGIEMDLASKPALENLSGLGKEVGRNLRSSKKADVELFFNSQKTLKQTNNGKLS